MIGTDEARLGPAAWLAIGRQTWDGSQRNHVSLIAASVAFYAFLALWPTIAAAIAIWALVADQQQLTSQLAALSAQLPEQARDLVGQQLERIAGGVRTGASQAAIVGIALALYGSNQGMRALIEGLNIVLGVEERRGFFRLMLVSLSLTLVMIAGLLIAIAAVIVAPIVLTALGLGGSAAGLAALLRWPLLLGGVILVLGLVYGWAPSRSPAIWSWASPGAMVAAVVWVLGSMAFSLYVSHFGDYNAAYGSLAAIVILLLWLWLSAYIVLLGAELDRAIAERSGDAVRQ